MPEKILTDLENMPFSEMTDAQFDVLMEREYVESDRAIAEMNMPKTTFVLYTTLENNYGVGTGTNPRRYMKERTTCNTEEAFDTREDAVARMNNRMLGDTWEYMMIVEERY